MAAAQTTLSTSVPGQISTFSLDAPGTALGLSTQPIGSKSNAKPSSGAIANVWSTSLAISFVYWILAASTIMHWLFPSFIWLVLHTIYCIVQKPNTNSKKSKNATAEDSAAVCNSIYHKHNSLVVHFVVAMYTLYICDIDQMYIYKNSVTFTILTVYK